MPIQALKNFALTSKQHYLLVKPTLDLHLFLHNAAYFKYDKVVEGLKNSIHFVHKKGEITDGYDCSFFSISSYQYALLVADKKMLALMENCLSGVKEDADIRRRLLAQTDEIQTNPICYTLDGVLFSEDFIETQKRYHELVTSSIFKTMYEWVNTLTKKSFDSIVKWVSKDYERNLCTWFTPPSGIPEILSNQYNPAKTLALIFMTKTSLSTLNQMLFTKIIKCIQRETMNSLKMQTEFKYRIMSQFDLDKFKDWENLSNHLQTIKASNGEFDLEQNDVTDKIEVKGPITLST